LNIICVADAHEKRFHPTLKNKESRVWQTAQGNMDKGGGQLGSYRDNSMKSKTKNKPKSEKVTNQTKNKGKKEWKQR